MATAFPRAIAAVDAWQKARMIGIPPGERTTVLVELCQAAALLIQERNLSTDTIDSRSRESVFDYLDRLKDPLKPGRTLASTIRSQFQEQGLSRPTAKQYGLVRFDYVHPVDALRIRNQTMDPWPSVLIVVGPARIVGTSKTQAVCSGDVEVSAAVERKFSC